MTEKDWARVYYSLIAFMFISLNIGIISLILQKPKPALGDRGLLTMALLVIDVIALARAWAIWHHARRTASSSALQNLAELSLKPSGGTVKDRGDPTLKSAFFCFAFCLLGAVLLGTCIVAIANPHDHTFPAGFKWAMIPPAALFFLVFLTLLFFIGRFIVRTVWKKWKAKW